MPGWAAMLDAATRRWALQLPLLTFSTTPANEYLLFIKRGLDLILSTVLIVILSPLLLALSAVFAHLPFGRADEPAKAEFQALKLETLSRAGFNDRGSQR